MMNAKFFFFGLIALSASLTSNAQETVIPQADIPGEIRSYVQKYFPDQKLIQAVKDRDDFTVKYEILLDNRISLEFNRNKQITEIESKSKLKLPDATIPPKILSYVRSNYPNNHIKGWELDKKKQQIKLDNGLELEFDRKGAFLRIDD